MTAPVCAICLDQLYENYQQIAIITTCGHSFHAICIFQAHNRDPRCPVCRGPIPDRNFVARITFQSGEEPRNNGFEVNHEQDDGVFDENTGNEVSNNDNRPSDEEHTSNNLSRVFAEHTIQQRRIQEEMDNLIRFFSTR